MKLKQLIAEQVLSSTISDTLLEIEGIKEQLLEQLIIEGVDDPGILKVVFMAGGPGCFVGDTLVKTTEGYKPISTIQSGELVYTVNEQTSETEVKPVVESHLYSEHTEDLLELEFDTGDIVRCTENHKFYVDGEWIKAKYLTELIRKTNLGKCTVPVYDLTVLDNSNYQITKSDIIVHNSGKSYTANDIYGVDQRFKNSFSATGLKVVNSDGAFSTLLKKNGIDPRELSKIEKEEPELWDKITKDPGGIRDKAKQLTNKQKQFYEAGRLGMIIDGTGHDFNKIKKMKQHAEELGYDTAMLFVDTSLDVAMARNKSRGLTGDRVLPDELVQQSWKSVQNNKAEFKNLFGGNFTTLDNTVFGPPNKEIVKATRQFISKPVHNPVGKKWIMHAKMLKSRSMIR